MGFTIFFSEYIPDNPLSGPAIFFCGQKKIPPLTSEFFIGICDRNINVKTPPDRNDIRSWNRMEATF